MIKINGQSYKLYYQGRKYDVAVPKKVINWDGSLHTFVMNSGMRFQLNANQIDFETFRKRWNHYFPSHTIDTDNIASIQDVDDNSLSISEFENFRLERRHIVRFIDRAENKIMKLEAQGRDEEVASVRREIKELEDEKLALEQKMLRRVGIENA